MEAESIDPSHREARIFDVYTSRNLHVSARIYDPTAPICVSFASGGRPRDLTGDATAAKYGYNCICVATKEMDWFQYPDLPDAEAAIRHVTASASRVVTYGFSMGAYGALICSGPLKADVVLAFSPQAAMGSSCPVEESRWADDRARIGSELGFPHDDMASRLTRAGEAILVYDPLDEDIRHIRMIKALRPTTDLIVPLAAHSTLPLLARMGLASSIVRDVMDGSFTVEHYRREIRQRRTRDIRIDGLTAALAHRGRRMSSALLEQAARVKLPIERTKKFARDASSGSHATALVRFMQTLLFDPTYLKDPRYPIDIVEFAPVAVRSAEVGGLINTLHSRIKVTEDAGRRIGWHIAIAHLQLALENEALAREEILKASAIVSAWDPQNANLATLLRRVGLEDRANDFEARIRAREGGDFSSFEVRARPLERDGDWTAAMKVWAEAAASGTSSARVAVRLAKALMKLSRIDEAYSALAPALSARVVSPEALKMAGSCASKLGDGGAALEFFSRAVTAAPADHAAARLLSNALLSSGDLIGAFREAQRSNDLRPSESAALHLSRVQARLGKIEAKSAAQS